MSDSLGPRIAEGRDAEVYAWGDAVLKLYRPGSDGHRAESAALARLDGTGVVPRLIRTVRVDGRDGLVLERLAGSDMLLLLERRSWKLIGYARALARAQLRIHAVPAPADLPDLRERLAARIGAADLSQPLRDFALRTLEGLPAGDRLCHGDLHPGNVLVAADRVTVIDWTTATRGVPAADLARTILILRNGAPLPGSSRLLRVLLATGRSAFAGAFERTYRRHCADRPQQVAQWTVVHAAARLTEDIAPERPRLVDLLDRARRRAAR